ncbi:hypothetical protein ABH945_003406 [Paraburkholderia sp. GAS333]
MDLKLTNSFLLTKLAIFFDSHDSREVYVSMNDE